MKQVTKGQWNGYDTYILHSRELKSPCCRVLEIILFLFVI